MILVGALALATAVVCAICLPFAPASARLDVPRARDALRGARELLRRGRGEATTAILQTTSAALRSGVGVASALAMAVDGLDPHAAQPYARALREFRLNGDLAAALSRSRAREHDRRVLIALDALSLVARDDLPGTRAAAVVAAIADRLAFDARVRDEVDARASGVRWQIALLALLVPGVAIYLVFTMPALAVTLATPLGTHLLIPAAATLELLGVIASRALVRGLT